MNSLEALKGINTIINEAIKKDLLTLKGSIKLIGYSSIIKQDLEKLEHLEKENQELIVNKNVAQAVAFDQKCEIGELKDQLSQLKEESENWQSAYEWAQSKNSILKLENEELKSKYNDLMLDFKMFDFNTLKQENEKLKKAIEIIKNKDVDINLLISSNCLEDYNYQYSIPLTQQEYELLKEVLK